MSYKEEIPSPFLVEEREPWGKRIANFLRATSDVLLRLAKAFDPPAPKPEKVPVKIIAKQAKVISRVDFHMYVANRRYLVIDYTDFKVIVDIPLRSASFHGASIQVETHFWDGTLKTRIRTAFRSDSTSRSVPELDDTGPYPGLIFHKMSYEPAIQGYQVICNWFSLELSRATRKVRVYDLAIYAFEKGKMRVEGPGLAEPPTYVPEQPKEEPKPIADTQVKKTDPGDTPVVH